jgi:hypothetical protein
MNICFEYLYRDAGNFKNWGEVVFANPNNLIPDELSSLVENLLIEQLYFVAEKASVPTLYFESYFPHLDHGWHELNRFSATEEAANDPLGRDIGAFIKSLKFAAS